MPAGVEGSLDDALPGVGADFRMFKGATCALERLSMPSKSSTRSCASEAMAGSAMAEEWAYRGVEGAA